MTTFDWASLFAAVALASDACAWASLALASSSFAPRGLHGSRLRFCGFDGTRFSIGKPFGTLGLALSFFQFGLNLIDESLCRSDPRFSFFDHRLG